MVALAGNQIWWTWEVEDVFHKAKKGGKTAMKVCRLDLLDIYCLGARNHCFYIQQHNNHLNIDCGSEIQLVDCVHIGLC